MGGDLCWESSKRKVFAKSLCCETFFGFAGFAACVALLTQLERTLGATLAGAWSPDSGWSGCCEGFEHECNACDSAQQLARLALKLADAIERRALFKVWHEDVAESELAFAASLKPRTAAFCETQTPSVAEKPAKRGRKRSKLDEAEAQAKEASVPTRVQAAAARVFKFIEPFTCWGVL